MCTPRTVARIFIDGRTFHKKRLVGKFKQRTNQARSKNLKKGGGGFFERVGQLQATLTQIFIVLESKLHGLSEIEWDFSAKIGNSNAFSARKQVISKKKRSSPKLRRMFIGNSNGFQSRITATTSQLRHPNFFGGDCLYFFSKIGLKSTKTVRFYILYWPMGRLEPFRPSPGCATGTNIQYHYKKPYHTNVPYPNHKKKGVPYRTVILDAYAACTFTFTFHDVQ